MEGGNRKGKKPAGFRQNIGIGLAVAGWLAAGPLPAQFAVTQLTNTTGSLGANSRPSMTPSGSRIAFESDRDLTGGNGDLNREVFLQTDGVGLTQLTNSAGCFSSDPTIASDGRRIAFRSTCNLTGVNADENGEIFLWTEGVGFTQLTDAVGGSGSSDPSIAANGRRIAFSSERDLIGGNADLSFEIFLWIEGSGLLQITNSTIAESFEPAANSDGTRVAFSSDGNLTGGNADLSLEVFLWVEGGGLTQITQTTGGFADRASINGAGTRIAFESDRNLAAGNAGLTEQIFLWKKGGGISQITHGNGNFTRMASIDAGGTKIAFASNSNLTGGNPGLREQIFRWIEGVGLEQITSASGGSTRRPSVSAGAARVAFDSDGDLSGQNADRNTELFLATALLPAAPSGLTARLLAPRRVELRWTDNAVNEAQIEVELRLGSAPFAVVKTLTPNSTRAVLKGLQPNSRYTARVRCRNSSGPSGYSPRVVFTTPR